MSAFIQDVAIRDLPKEVRDIVTRFTGAKKDHKVAHYGMTAKELIGKADPHNLATARKNVRTGNSKTARRDVNMAVRKGRKYVLVQNDRIVDGHHHLAKAEHGNVTSSLNVLDLTPTRFQMQVKGGRIIRFSRPIGYEAGVPFTGKVVRDKYVKKIRDEDLDRRDANIGRAVVAGTLAGALGIRGGRILTRAALGGAAGAGGVLAIRAITKKTRDPYGERSRGAKQAEKIPAAAALGVAGLGAIQIARKKFKMSAKGRIIRLEKKRELNPAVKAGLSAAVSGAALGFIPAFRRGTGLRTVLKSVTTGAAAGGAVVGGGTVIGSKILGDPKPNEGAPITKRAALGSAIAAAPVGIIGGVLLHKTPAGRAFLKKSAKKWRPAVWAQKTGPLGAAGIAGVAATVAAGAHAADEGQQVDTLNSLKKDRPKIGFSAEGRMILLSSWDDRNHAAAAGYLAAGGGVAYAGYRVAKAAKAAEATAKESQKTIRGARLTAGRLKRQLTTFPTFRKIGRSLRLLQDGSVRVIEFGRSDQPRWRATNRYADPVEGYARRLSLINSDRSEWTPSSPQVANSVYRQAKKARVTVQRSTGLASDAVAHLTGAPRQRDAAGREKKREWEKSWFKNAATTAGIAATIGSGVLLRRYARTNPHTPTARIVKRTEARARLGRQKLEHVAGRAMDAVAGTFGLESRERNTILFDAYAEMRGWDLRDARGKSARVYAPGSRRRIRRPADWHETKQGQRHILTGAGVAATLAAGTGAFLIGKRIGGKQAVARVLKVAEENKKASIAKGLETRRARIVRENMERTSGQVIQAFPKRRKFTAGGDSPTAA